MTKKLLTLLTLLLCVCSGAWADETIFHWAYAATSSVSTIENGNALSGATGGTITPNYQGNSVKNFSASDKVKGYADGVPNDMKSAGTVNSNSFTLKCGSGALYLQIQLTSGTFQAGDIIYICGSAGWGVSTVNNKGNNSGDVIGSIVTGTSNSSMAVAYAAIPNTFVASNTLYIARSTSTTNYICAIKVVRPATKTVTSKELTGININGSAWDIAGLTDNAATISTAQKGLPVVEFVYTINYDDSSSDTNQKETVVATKSGAKYVAASTVLTNNATLTFTDVQPYVFNMTDPTAPTDAVAQKTSSGVSATFSPGGSAIVYNGHKDNACVMVDGNGINLAGSGNSYFKASFSIALAEGDVIDCSNHSGTFYVWYSDSKTNSQTLPYVIPANSELIGKKAIYVKKDGATSFTSFSIARYPKHHVAYSIGAGTGTAPTQADVPETGTFTVASGDGFTAPTGKIFSCWNDGTNDYDAGDTYTMGTENVTLTAVYETAITATFANGGHGTAPDAQITTGTVVLSPIKVDWYENDKWIADRDVEVDDATVTAGTAIAAGKTAVMSENTTFTAQWTYTGKPYIEGIALPEPATNALDIATQALFTPSNGYVVLNPNSVRGNNTTGYWFTTYNANKAVYNWTAPDGSVFSDGSSENAVILRTDRTYAVKFTGTTEFKALMNSRKDGASNKVKAMLVDYNGATPEKVGDIIEIGNFGTGTAALTNDAIATFSGLDASHTYTVFFYGYDSSTNAVLYEVAFQIPVPADPTASGDETYLTTSDNMAGWRAFYDASNSYSVDGNTKVYVADVDPVGTTITLKSIEGIPADVPVILHTSSSADSHKMTLTKETVSPFSYTGTNNLIWTASAVSEKYRLGFGASGVGFYPYSGTPASGAVILNVSSAAARALTFSFDDEVTGVKAIETNSQDPTANCYYDLQGRKVVAPTKGLYIVNGKKVVVK